MARRPARMSVEAVEATLSAAAAHYVAGRLDEAARGYGAVEAAAPRDHRAVSSLAMIDIRRGRLPEAVVRLKRVVKLEPDLYPALFNLGRASETLGHWRDAADAYARALALQPDATDTRFCLAVALAAIGRIDESVDHYRVLAADPRLGALALARLALIRPQSVADAELAAIQRAAEDAGVDAETRIGLHFAEGEVLEARGAYDKAFAAFAAGNRAKHAALIARGGVSDPRRVAQVTARSIARVEALFTSDFIAAHHGEGDPSVSPIFVVGMPRSGSTLIEQILASHPGVQGMGESDVMAELLRRSRAYDPAGVGRPGLFRALADAYLAQMGARGWTRRSRLVDKTLESYLHVGMIHLMFPRAVILNSVRDPLDTCVACYRQLFTIGNETLFDMAQIGEAYRGYRDLMDHWARVLPGRVIDVEYEALLADPEARIRWLVTEACGLAWDPRCLQFHKTERAVTTASAAQVRQPLFSTSVGRWRRYEGRLGPLIEALGPYASTGTHHSTQAPA
ncbi:MAG TPA: sulfotransferase [Caulobacteraceae bacterium]|nr:sulfotransferase [Caulobacteraceae bacterium]